MFYITFSRPFTTIIINVYTLYRLIIQIKNILIYENYIQVDFGENVNVSSILFILLDPPTNTL